MDSLKNYGTKLRASVEALASIANLEALKEKKLHEVDRLIEQPEGLNRLPGKQILRRFLDEHADISSEDYLNVAVSTVLDKGITLGEIERLKGAISKRRGT